MTVALTHIDKEKWPVGQWNLEPDRLEYIDDKTCLPALIDRAESGALTGFVMVPSGHPWHGLDFAEVGKVADVHGELHSMERADGSWWFGFSCDRRGDMKPAKSKAGTYRDLSFVKAGVASLAAQVVAAGPPAPRRG